MHPDEDPRPAHEIPPAEAAQARREWDDVAEFSYTRERPIELDPLADYDGTLRKQPKRLGAMETFRALPWLVAAFDGRVPGAFIAQIDDGLYEIACPCGASPHVRFNVLEPCPGECGRHFFFDGRLMRVARGEPHQLGHLLADGYSD